MVQRTNIQLPDDVHKYLTGIAHERSMAGNKRVSLSTVVSEICVIAVESMRETDAKRAAEAVNGRG